MNQLNNLFLAKGKVWEKTTLDNLEFFTELKLPEADLGVRWVGPKIPTYVWDQVIAFFELSFHETNGETQARFYFNKETGEWKAWAFPQRSGTGMTTQELGDDPRRKTQDEEIGSGFRIMGTIHHHCRMGAFQSHTDRNNEETQGGLHITVGHIGMDRYDLHGRVVLRGEQYQLVWSEWFETDENIEQELKKILERLKGIEEYKELFPIPTNWNLDEEALRNKFVENFLTIPPHGDVEIPDQWMKNLVPTTHTFGPTGSHMGGYPHMRGEFNKSPDQILAEKELEKSVKELNDLSEICKLTRKRTLLLLEGIVDKRMNKAKLKARSPRGGNEERFFKEADELIMKAEVTVGFMSHELEEYWEAQDWTKAHEGYIGGMGNCE